MKRSISSRRRRGGDRHPKVVGAFEAKTHLAALLDRVQRGDVITIARNGVPVARLVPVEDVVDRPSPDEIVARFRAFREAHPIHGVTTRDLVNEGRRV